MARLCHLKRVLALGLLISSSAAADREGPARNAILFVGDGMGIPVVTAARIYARGPAGRLAMELPHVALVRTFSLDRMVADSASTATALFSGHRVRSGVVGMGPETPRGCSIETRRDGSPNPVHPCGEAADPVESLADLAVRSGMAVGIVTTTRVTHATPAAMYAHVDERDSEAEIARQLVERADLSFVAGGGRRYFLPQEPAEGPSGGRDDGRDLVAQLREKGYEVALTGRDLRRAVIERRSRIVGLLADDHLPFDLERGGPTSTLPDLAELTGLAIRHLERHPEGYLLLVEGGRIDHALHGNLARIALEETVAFDVAVADALSRAGEDTLVLVTADHGHPLVVVGYALVEDSILGVAREGAGVERRDEDGDGLPDPMLGVDGKGMTTLLFGNGPGHGADGSGDAKAAESPREDPILLGEAIRGAGYRQESAVPLGASTHEGSDVMVAARGPGAERVAGFLDQTEIFGIVATALGLAPGKAEPQ